MFFQVFLSHPSLLPNGQLIVRSQGHIGVQVIAFWNVSDFHFLFLLLRLKLRPVGCRARLCVKQPTIYAFFFVSPFFLNRPENTDGSTGSGFLRGRLCAGWGGSPDICSPGSRVKRLIEQAERQMAGK